MRPSAIGLFFTLFFTACHAQEIRVSGADGTGELVFSDGANGSYKSLFYKNHKGKRFDIFDSGLEFNYIEGSDFYLSPDKTHFFVNFSEIGSIEDGISPANESREYICAFVRMSDGCVVHVDSAGVCGGEWKGSGEWIGADGFSIGNLDANQTTAKKIYFKYLSGFKDASISSSPKVLKYLPEGTAFDNLLACDPVSPRSQKSYEKLLKLLRRDGDSIDVKKIIKAMGKRRI